CSEPRGRGGTGRRAGLRILWGNPSGFDSRRSHETGGSDMESVSHFLDTLGGTVFRLAAILFVIVNGAAIVVFAMTRNRRLVDAWTRRIVTIDAVLLGAGLGVPLLAAGAKLGIKALAGVTGGLLGLFK